MATKRACLLVADISGYTGYLAGVELDHAHGILAALMDTIVGALPPGFRLALGRVSFLQTTELEPTPGGTTLHMRMAAPSTLRERTVRKLAAPMPRKGDAGIQHRLTEQLDAESDRLGGDTPE